MRIRFDKYILKFRYKEVDTIMQVLQQEGIFKCEIVIRISVKSNFIFIRARCLIKEFHLQWNFAG